MNPLDEARWWRGVEKLAREFAQSCRVPAHHPRLLELVIRTHEVKLTARWAEGADVVLVDARAWVSDSEPDA